MTDHNERPNEERCAYPGCDRFRGSLRHEYSQAFPLTLGNHPYQPSAEPPTVPVTDPATVDSCRKTGHAVLATDRPGPWWCACRMRMKGDPSQAGEQESGTLPPWVYEAADEIMEFLGDDEIGMFGNIAAIVARAWNRRTHDRSITPSPAESSVPSERDEAWQHAACLSIAEGAPGWGEPTYSDSPAMVAVRTLRSKLEIAERALKEIDAEGPCSTVVCKCCEIVEYHVQSALAEMEKVGGGV